MTFLLNRGIAEFLFEGFSIQRWNDRLRPIPLCEMDKNACKMMLTYFIGKIYESKGEKIDWKSLIDKGIYNIIIKTCLSDISPKVHNKLRENGEEYSNSIKKVVKNSLENLNIPREYIEKFEVYITNERSNMLSAEDHILRLCHHISVNQEYKILTSLEFNCRHPEHDICRDELAISIDKCMNDLDLIDIKNAGYIKEIYHLIDCLRLQIRWSQTIRLPSTSVLGHSLYAAMLMYFAIENENMSETRKINNFYATLMHDFMESYTRDIISPVKTSSDFFQAEISKIEQNLLNNSLRPKLHEAYREDFIFLIEREFLSRYTKGGILYHLPQITQESTKEDMEEYNEIANAEFSIDGSLVKVVDYLAALIEAHQSIKLGISSYHLAGAISRLYASFSKIKGGIPSPTMREGFTKIYDEFISK